MFLDYKNNLEDMIEPKVLRRYIDQLKVDGNIEQELLQLPFICVENEDTTTPTVSFWKPKDVCKSDNEAAVLGASYCDQFMHLCAKYKCMTLFPLIIATMMKNGDIGALEKAFLGNVERFARIGMAAAANKVGWPMSDLDDGDQNELPWGGNTRLQ